MQEIYNFHGQEVRTVTIDNEPLALKNFKNQEERKMLLTAALILNLIANIAILAIIIKMGNE